MSSRLKGDVKRFDLATYESHREKPLEDYECIGTVIVDSAHGARSGSSSSYNDLRRIKTINQKSKDIVLGYIREHDDTEKTATPELVKYLSLIYWYETDEWNIEEMHYMELIGNTIKYFGKDVGYEHYGFAYLKNEVSSGIHKWKFKCHHIARRYIGDHIGIRLKSWNRWDYDDLPFDGTESYGCYFSLVYGGSVSLSRSAGWRHLQGDYHIERGGTLEMTVNFQDLTLSYKVNSVPIDYLKKSIKPGTYVAGIETSSGHHYELVSYHHIY